MLLRHRGNPEAVGFPEQLRKSRNVSWIKIDLLLSVGPAETPPSALQPFEAYCAKPRFSSPVHLQRCSTSDSVRDLY
jgi:hypothetical protein